MNWHANGYQTICLQNALITHGGGNELSWLGNDLLLLRQFFFLSWYIVLLPESVSLFGQSTALTHIAIFLMCFSCCISQGAGGDTVSKPENHSRHELFLSTFRWLAINRAVWVSGQAVLAQTLLSDSLQTYLVISHGPLGN